ncbi:MAG: HAMP domain-containing protein [Clostridia bacterium]|nr:HAMP domain-containing protein [Clostridia bacterium]MBQ3057456.1 HAMP domain-containing protein [Clostridia bacterium]
MNLEIKFKSITVKWFFNIFLVIAVVICTAAIGFSVLYNALYTSQMQALGDDYAYEFKSLEGANSKTFNDSAIALVEGFAFKNKVAVQVTDKNGRVVATTTGFPTEVEDIPEYQLVINSGRSQSFRGKTADGESIMAVTTPIFDDKGNFLGTYRWSTSMNEAYKAIYSVISIIVLACFAVLLFSCFSGLFFVKSIVRPIRDVSNIARKIAMGNFDERIQMTKNDEIGELCDTINYMASELSQAQNMKNDFISSVSHELRTPLTAIRGWGETAKMSLGTDEELVRRGLDVVLSESDRLSSLVEELLDFSRMETGRLSLTSQPINVTSILSDAVDMYTELAKKQEIELVHTNPHSELIVMGDRDRLKQVFINIIDNAVKYTVGAGQVLVSANVEEACVRITVTDTGVGIPSQDIDRVKEKFYKANKTVRGSGIGLAVADEIIKQMNGLLFIESTENVGTKVTIVLPLYEEEIIPQEEGNVDGK